jgi:ABC-2 type transport system ATP-binding protein
VLHIRLAGSLDEAAKLIEQHETVDVVNITEGQLVVTLKEGAHDYSELPTLLIERGHKITMFKEDELDLEGAFMALTKGITA